MDPTTPNSPSDAGAGSRPPQRSHTSPVFSTPLASAAAGAKAVKGIGPIPAGKVVAVPHKPKLPRKKSAIPLATAIAAATKAGRMVLDVRAMRDETLLGKFIQQSGAKDLGRYRIALSASRVDDVDRVLVELDNQAATTGGAAAIETRLAIQRTRIEALEAGTRVGLALLETEELPEATSIRPPVLPGFGSGVGAVQINVSGGATVIPPPV